MAILGVSIQNPFGAQIPELAPIDPQNRHGVQVLCEVLASGYLSLLRLLPGEYASPSCTHYLTLDEVPPS